VSSVGSSKESSLTPFAVWSNVGTLREYAEARRFIFRGNARLGFVLQQLAQPTADAEIFSRSLDPALAANRSRFPVFCKRVFI
jgi:hypothetical protein